MEFVPKSNIQIHNTSEITNIINDLPISCDLIETILSYDTNLLSIPRHNINDTNEVDSFWLKVGLELSNLKAWGTCC